MRVNVLFIQNNDGVIHFTWKLPLLKKLNFLSYHLLFPSINVAHTLFFFITRQPEPPSADLGRCYQLRNLNFYILEDLRF